MENLREFLLSRKGWRDEKGNTLAFFAQGLDGQKEDDEIWLFLDEGLRCGGLQKRFVPEETALEDILIGLGKKELWILLKEDIREWRERG